MDTVARFQINPLVLILVLSGLLTACSVTTAEPLPGNCVPSTAGILIVPTATRQSDPDLFSPPAPPDGGDGMDYCPTPVPAEIPVANFPIQFVTTEVVNLSLDIVNQELAATAVGDDMLAVAWIMDGEIYVALSRGGNHFQVRRVDSGQNVSMMFSRVNRLHVAYEQDGQILYRAADQGTHPADVEPIFVEYGQNPKVGVDELNWAHVLYEQDGSIFKAKHLSNDNWLTQFVTYGADLAVMPFYNEQEVVFFGVPASTYWFGIILAAPYDGQVRIFRYLSWFNLWEQIAAFPISAGEELTGAVGLDYLAISEEEAWVYAVWVTKRPSPQPPLPLYVQPVYEATNPLFPNQLANPQYIYEGLNAVRWYKAADPFDAGLKQTVSIPDPSGIISFEAWGVAETAAGADFSLRIGVDPAGGDNPDSANVVWSPGATPDTFTQFLVSVPAAGPTATVFLEATLNTANVPGMAVWDAAAVQNGVAAAGSAQILTNGDFEGPFTAQNTLTVPDGWSAYYQDSGNAPTGGRDLYTVYAAWSSDGGLSWSAPEAVVENRDATGLVTGAIQPDVYPLISTATETPSASFFYIYEAGDPPPGTEFLRFGRPTMTICDLGTAVTGESVILQRLPVEEPTGSTSQPEEGQCITDAAGECTWFVGRGLYQVLFDRPLDDVSAIALAEGGLLGLGITVGDEPITYHFTFYRDGRVYFDSAPDAAVPSPVIPSFEALHGGAASTPALPVMSSTANATEPVEATPSPVSGISQEAAEHNDTSHKSWRVILFAGLGIAIGGGLHLLLRRRQQSMQQTIQPSYRESDDA